MLTETETAELKGMICDEENETIDQAIKEIFCEKPELFAGGMMDLSHIIGYFEDKTLLENKNLQSIFNTAKTIPFIQKMIQIKVDDGDLISICGVIITRRNYLLAKYLLAENFSVHYKSKESPIFFTDEKRLVVIAPRIEDEDDDGKPEKQIDFSNYMLYLFSDLFLVDPVIVLLTLKKINDLSRFWHVNISVNNGIHISLGVRK